MHLDLRLRLFLAYLRWAGRGATGPFTSADIERMRAAEATPSTPLTRRLFGARHPGVGVRDLSVPGAPDPVALRVYRPVALSGAARPPVVVFFHGGGWALGSLDAYDAIASRIAADAGVVVASVDYRLAPDHPFPHGLDDAVTATAWVADHAAELGVDGSRLAVAGDSAGGNLAAVVALRARDEGGPPIRQQTLVYPVTDLTERDDVARGADLPVLSARAMRGLRDFYLGGTPDTDPHVSPLHADDLAGLPPALVITAEHDPLRGQGRNYAAALAAAGVPTRATDYVGTVHGFLSFPGIVPVARQAHAEIAAELRRHLEVTAADGAAEAAARS